MQRGGERKIAPMFVASTMPSKTAMRRAPAQTLSASGWAGRRMAHRMPRGQGVPREARQHLPRPGVRRNAGAAVQQGAALALQVPALHEKGQGDDAGVQGPEDDLRAFGDENAFLDLPAAAQLGLRQAEKTASSGAFRSVISITAAMARPSR